MDGNELTEAESLDSPKLSQKKNTYRPSSNFWLITSLVVMVLSIAWFFYATRSPKQITSKPTPIVSAPVINRDMPIYLSALGNVVPTYNVTVRSQIMGVLQKVFFKEGQFVKKGELLAQIDPRPYEALLKQYEGNLERDRALLANARIDLKRYQNLWKQDSISQQTLATQQALVEQYEGAVKTDEGLIESTKINLIYCRIVSPIAGRIGLRLVDAGNLIQLSDTTGIAVITTINPITVIFSLPEDYIPGLINQVYENKKVKVYAYDRQQKQQLAAGRLITLDNQIDPSTGTVKLRAEFSNKENKLFPNQFVNIKILIETLKNAVVVPTAAVQHTLTYDFVYVLDKQKVLIKKISSGPSIGNETIIDKGLTPGQLVVIEGADKLVNGAHVINEEENSKSNSSKPKKSQTT
ncbi:efflux RND transporter periplasmic adaptor subunit [Legionella sp. km772]|uniref:efflux RND transporter periplasmic adaptor subunit n=1 Tax=Legionella sp. km772 TaxID=2498111 RepID=UPI000F8C30EB|nr:efflux RND transporter periplasmic adaptor subunit [Legionella sp. km772]RUR10001.1 efflux RND transporter periplasmic adaptor subunit [Legionella sp. km772]